MVRVGIDHLRQYRGGNAESLEELRVPFETANIEQHRPGSVGDIGRVATAAGQPPKEKTVDRAEGDFPRRAALAKSRDGIEQPTDLRR
jgi:hypothetical protein